MAQPLFPPDRLEGHLRSLIPSLERSGDSLRWAAGDGISELSLTPIQQLTFDGLTVAEVATLTHSSPYLVDFSPDLIARLNSRATISSLVPADGNSPARFVSKVGIFSTDREAAERNYAPLIALEAAIIGWHAAHMARGDTCKRRKIFRRKNSIASPEKQLCFRSGLRSIRFMARGFKARWSCLFYAMIPPPHGW